MIRQYAFNYTNKHREELESQQLNEFIQWFEINSDQLKDLAHFCKKEGLELAIDQFSLYDETILSTQLKAYIARNIWNDEGFFPVIHEIDYSFQQAIKQ